jgi:drug/metabolite transporter (DMT)-like permease
VIFGIAFGGETIGWHTAFGGAAIIGGVALAILSKKREPGTRNREL